MTSAPRAPVSREDWEWFGHAGHFICREEPTYCNECLDESFAAGGHFSERMVERAVDAADRMRDE